MFSQMFHDNEEQEGGRGGKEDGLQHSKPEVAELKQIK